MNQLLSLIDRSGIDPPTLNELLNRVFVKYGVVLAILFGSRARGGSAREDSDYDIAVLAKNPLNHEEVVGLVKDLADALGVPVDKVDLVDLGRAPNELVYVVLRDGVPIYAIDWELARRLIAHMYVRILGESDLDHVYYRVFRDRISKKRY
ncbi:nucleotidyltransferase domain-containing protein [Vulcanisaeta distributa]|uniref:type VII toxin-antitoxin system MntA family adenylyltransferase antitoxin n=1 Tax=Vulcanisaeta distributa TaxID=164451 RepID=UPI0006D24F2C|nr:nucleotidyltransferase domain-containing protein [Vulcanisaeta distributa]